MRWNPILWTATLTLLLAGPASAVSIVISGPSAAEVGDTVTFTASLDEETALNGYQLSIFFDESELALVPRTNPAAPGAVLGNLFPDNSFLFSPVPSFTVPIQTQLPFDQETQDFRALIVDVTGNGAATTDLFELDFEVLAGAGVSDGVDFAVGIRKGTDGLSGPIGIGDVPIASGGGVEVEPGSVVFDYVSTPTDLNSVPEPSIALMAGLGLAGIAALGRRR